VVFGQTPAHGFAGKADVLSEPDQFTRQKPKRPTRAARKAQTDLESGLKKNLRMVS
jgi:hypothetical protein